MWKHLKYIISFPKIGPDMYFTHWQLFFKPLRIWLQKRRMGKNIGENSELRPYCVLDGYNNIIIGKDVIIPEGVRLVTDSFDESAKIIIGDGVLFAPNVSVYCTTHTYSSSESYIKSQPLKNKTTTIKSGSWIGINSIILPGVTIGRNCVIGANSIVNKDIPDCTVAVGSPARIIKKIN